MTKILSLDSYLIIGIILLILARFFILPFSPPGFFLDESAGAAHVVSMLSQSTNAHGEGWPLFSESLGGGYTTPVYLYPLVAWAFFAGTSELSLRFFSQITTIIAIILIGVSMRLWLSRTYGLVAVIVALSLPWGWLQGSIAWDPALVPLFVSLAFLSFSIIWQTNNAIAFRIGSILLPLSLIALAYLYPPCRVTAPFLFIGAYWMLIKYKKITLKHLGMIIGISVVLSLPLLLFMLSPASLARSRELSVFFQHSVLEGILLFIYNSVLMLNPNFLFITGDTNLRHATGLQGMLGIGAILPIAFLLGLAYKKKFSFRSTIIDKRKLLILISIFGIFVAMCGSALTNEGQPHSLRAVAMWPFFVILITLGWSLIVRSSKKWVVTIAIAFFVLGTVWYAIDLALFYPTRASSSFDVKERDAIIQGYSPDYPQLSLKYYRLR